MTVTMMCFYEHGHKVYEVYAIDAKGNLMDDYDYLFFYESEALDKFQEIVEELCR